LTNATIVGHLLSINLQGVAMSENEKLVLKAVVLREGKKTLACAQARVLSRDHDISLKEIGEACNRSGIKIVECELGCFK
jgi:hypothetical protein